MHALSHRAAALATAAAALAALVLPAAAVAQAWPARPVKLIAPYAAGGPTDVMARLVAAEMGPVLGQPMVVENRPGAAGAVGADVVAKSAPDGYTVCFCTTGPTVLMPLLEPKLPYKAERDLLPVGQVHRLELSFLLGPNVKAKTIAELVTLAKANPGKLTYASPGSGSPNHLGGELLKAMTDIDLLHVPYKGENPAMVDVLAGRVDMMVGSVFIGEPHVKAGKLRMIAVTGPTRAPRHGDVPTVGETIAGYEATSHVGLHVPAGTPPEIIDKLNAAMRQALAQPALRERMLNEGITPVGSSAKEYTEWLQRETAKWRKLIAEKGIKLD